MTHPAFQRLDLSSRRRLFVAGDIHGTFDLLNRRLAEVSFDPKHDAIVLLGDLVDRGAYDLQALEWCQRPGFFRIQGNHEQLLANAVYGGDQGLLDHLQNGGQWFLKITDRAERQLWADTLINAPIAIEAITPGGRRVGFVHADVPVPNWTELVTILQDNSSPEYERIALECLWSRDRIAIIKANAGNLLANPRALDTELTIPGIDHVFFGHSIVSTPTTCGNCSWIDTGAFKSQILTLVDVDQWVAGQHD